MASITLDTVPNILASKRFTSASPDSGAVPSWARVMTVTRMGTYGTDDVVVSLAAGAVTCQIPVAAGGAPVAIPLVPLGSSSPTPFTGWSIAGTDGVITGVQFDGGLTG